MRRRDDPTPPAVSFPSPFPSRTAPSHSERRTRACGEGPKRGEKGATRVENGGPVVTENPTEGNWTVSRLSTSRSLRLFISLHSLPSFLGTEWRGWEASVTRRTDDERSERGWSERVSDKRRVTTEDPYDPASVGSCLTAQPGLPHGLSSSAHTVPIPFTLAALNLTSRKGSFMKVSIILGDRRERSEQREPRMGGNRSERSRVSSGVVDSRPFLRHVRFISLSILLHSTLSGRRPPVASLRGWSRVMNVVNEPDDRRRVTRPAPFRLISLGSVLLLSSLTSFVSRNGTEVMRWSDERQRWDTTGPNQEWDGTHRAPVTRLSFNPHHLRTVNAWSG